MCSQHRLPRGSNAGYAHGHARVHASLGKGGGKRGLISIRFSLSLWFHVHACTRVRLLQFGSFPWEACVFSHSLPERFCEGGTRNRVCARRHFSSVCFSAFRVRGGTHRLCHRLASAVRSSCSASSSTRTSRSRCSGLCSLRSVDATCRHGDSAQLERCLREGQNFQTWPEVTCKIHSP